MLPFLLHEPVLRIDREIVKPGLDRVGAKEVALNNYVDFYRSYPCSRRDLVKKLFFEDFYPSLFG